MANTPVGLLKALFYAEWHMKEARAVCLQIQQLQPTAPPELVHGMYVGVVVSYAKPFGENRGVSKIGSSFTQFPTVQQQVLHAGILEARDVIYAHNDKASTPKRLRIPENAHGSEAAVLVHADGRATWRLRQAGFGIEIASEIIALCDLQIGRINAKSTGILRHFTDGKAYAPGEYTLGVNFP